MSQCKHDLPGMQQKYVASGMGLPRALRGKSASDGERKDRAKRGSANAAPFAGERADLANRSFGQHAGCGAMGHTTGRVEAR